MSPSTFSGPHRGTPLGFFPAFLPVLSFLALSPVSLLRFSFVSLYVLLGRPEANLNKTFLSDVRDSPFHPPGISHNSLRGMWKYPARPHIVLVENFYTHERQNPSPPSRQVVAPRMLSL